MDKYPSDVKNERTFLVSYNYDGAEWILELKATDLSDAKARLARLPYARIDGELMAKIPATLGPIAIAIAAIRNSLARVMSPH
ncbi:MAG: hypothetical protein JNK21_15200 [Rhodospirillaceae bacterium]|nr:hypothetical protein [Rhodospirillaceae bacterium]